MSKGWILFFGILVLPACAPEKKATDFSSLDNQNPEQKGGLCSPTYSPIGLQRDGLIPITNPDNLPVASYSYAGGEFYVREEAQGGGGFQAHFSEEYRDLGLLVRKVCSTALPKGIVLEVWFPGVSEFSKTAENVISHRPNVTGIFGGGGSALRLTKGPSEPIVVGGIGGVLANYPQWRIYKTSESTMEIRASSTDVGDEMFLTKRMVLRFNRNAR